MTADEFVAATEALPPDRETFRAQLVKEFAAVDSALESSADVVNVFLRMFHFPMRQDGAVARFADPLVDLITRYDMTGFDSCGIRFNEAPEWADDVIVIGIETEESLVVDRASGEVQVIELHSRTLPARCAKDSARFFDALLPLVALGKRKIAYGIDIHDGTHGPEAVARCTELAGGVRYQTFYRGVFA